ncbi:MAG: choice-of-anchor Q domain-containing protein, partial [Acidimicrobiia bacterium]
NYSDDASCALGSTGDVVNGSDPLLGPLAAGIGATLARTPQTAGPLLDHIPPSACAFDGIATDQWGTTRAQGPGCDVGTIEVVVVAPVTVQPTFTG